MRPKGACIPGSCIKNIRFTEAVSRDPNVYAAFGPMKCGGLLPFLQDLGRV